MLWNWIASTYHYESLTLWYILKLILNWKIKDTIFSSHWTPRRCLPALHIQASDFQLATVAFSHYQLLSGFQSIRKILLKFDLFLKKVIFQTSDDMLEQKLVSSKLSRIIVEEGENTKDHLFWGLVDHRDQPGLASC